MKSNGPVRWLCEVRASTILYKYLVGLEREFEFLLPANICPIVPSVFLKARVAFRLIDISPTSFSIDESVVEELLSHKQGKRGLLYARPYGYCADIDGWFDKLRRLDPELVIIDDRCLCRPQFQRISASANLTLFSTGYSKYVDLQYGGFACLVPDMNTYSSVQLPYSPSSHEQMVEEFRDSIEQRTRVKNVDTDWLDTSPPSRLFGEYRAQIERSLRRVDKHKDTVNKVYLELIPAELWLGKKFNDWRFNVLVNNKSELLEQIFRGGYFASSHYASMCGIFDNNQAPNAEALHSRVVNLFNDHRVTVEQAREVAKIVRDFVAQCY